MIIPPVWVNQWLWSFLFQNFHVSKSHPSPSGISGIGSIFLPLYCTRNTVTMTIRTNTQKKANIMNSETITLSLAVGGTNVVQFSLPLFLHVRRDRAFSGFLPFALGRAPHPTKALVLLIIGEWGLCEWYIGVMMNRLILLAVCHGGSWHVLTIELCAPQ